MTTKTAPAVAEKVSREPNWYEMLEEAVRLPGELGKAHRFFHKYSLANRWLASSQLRLAGLPLTPINTFKGWQGIGRMVNKGEKASIALIMPAPVHASKKDAETGEETKKVIFTKFMLRNYWFHLGQTQGEGEYVPETCEPSSWNAAAALGFLEMAEMPFAFQSVGDLRQSTSSGRTLAVSPMAEHPEFARILEMARIQMGHNDETPGKNVPADVHLREIEAQAAAYLCAATLDVQGIELARQVLQDNLGAIESRRIPAQCAKRAFAVADQLINAGYSGSL